MLVNTKIIFGYNFVAPLNLFLILFVLGLQLYTLQAAISQSHINFTVLFMTYFYMLNMPVYHDGTRTTTI